MHKQHYEKFADGIIKNIENEIPFEIPDTWCWCRLNSTSAACQNSFVDGPFGSNLKTEHYTTNREVRIVQLNNIGDLEWKNTGIKYTTFQHAKTLERCLTYNEDIVIAKMMPAGRAIIIPNFEESYIISSDCMRLRVAENLNNKYIMYAINSPPINLQIQNTVHGIGRSRTSLSKCKDVLIPMPPLAEQKKLITQIEELFAQVDKIEEEKQSLLKLIDKAKDKVLDLAMKGKLVKQDPNDEPASVLLEKIFEEKKKLAKEGKIKLSKDELLEPKISDDNDYYEKLGYNSEINWAKCQIRDVLYYEQPTKYIVEDTNYNEKYKTPVLTAGKSFILGYTNELSGIYDNLPCIIFDDFTTESKFVDFPFKVKSSAMKILNANSNTSIKYVFYLMQLIQVNINTHKRYWISDYSKREIIIPTLNNQNKIVKCVEDFIEYFNKIKAEL